MDVGESTGEKERYTYLALNLAHNTHKATGKCRHCCGKP